MGSLVDIDLKAFVINGIKELFGTMLSSMDVTVAEAPPGSSIKDNRIVGSVGFAGDIMGSINIQVDSSFAKALTATMLGMEQDEIIDKDEINDVIGEISNILGGYLKSRFCDSGRPCQLSIPSITSGSDFKIETIDYERTEHFFFAYQNYRGIVDLFIRTGK